MRLERLIHRRLCDRQQWKLLQKWNVDTQHFEAMTLSLDTIGEKITLYIAFPLVSPDFRSLMHSSPAWFSLLVALYLSGSGHQHELFRNERDLFVDSFHRFFRFFFLLPPLPSFLPRDIDRSREREREKEGTLKFWGCSFITRVTFDNTTLSNRPNGTRLYRNYAV